MLTNTQHWTLFNLHRHTNVHIPLSGSNKTTNPLNLNAFQQWKRQIWSILVVFFSLTQRQVLLTHLPHGWSGPTYYFSNYQNTLVPSPSLSLYTDKDSKRITQSLSHFWASRDSVALNGEYCEDSARMWSKYTGVLIWKTKNPWNGLSLLEVNFMIISSPTPNSRFLWLALCCRTNPCPAESGSGYIFYRANFYASKSYNLWVWIGFWNSMNI